jgi:hypothetical protein
MTRKLVFLSDSTALDSKTSSVKNSFTMNQSNKIQSPKRKTITTYEELCNLKPRSRLPIDITHLPQTLSHKNNDYSEMTDSTLKLNDTNINLNSKSSTTVHQTSNHNVSSRLNKTEPLHSVLNEIDTAVDNRKYFSFMTTNKLFNDLNMNHRKSIDNSELKLRIVNNQLVNEIDLNQKKKSNRYSSSSSDGSCHAGSDSGCGSSIEARSSIISSSIDSNDSKIFSSSININHNIDEKNNFNLNQESLALLSSSSSSTASSGQMKSICEKLFTKSSPLNSNLNLSINRLSNVTEDGSEVHKPKRQKILTILFDYETSCRNFNGTKNYFSLKKGQNVKVIRDYDEKFYLVATILDGRIGFVPKDYTVDLKEVEKRFNKKHVPALFPTDNSNESANHTFLNLKLTHL